MEHSSATVATRRKLLQALDETVRRRAVYDLARLGELSLPALPDLREAQDDPANHAMGKAIRSAIERIRKDALRHGDVSRDQLLVTTTRNPREHGCD